MGRHAREFSQLEIRAMVHLLDEGNNTKDIGKQQRPPCSANVVAHILRSRLGDLRAYKARAKGNRTRDSSTHLDYREGFEAGYRMSLTHVALHGIEAAREYCNRILLPWRDTGMPRGLSGRDDGPPEFLRKP